MNQTLKQKDREILELLSQSDERSKNMAFRKIYDDCFQQVNKLVIGKGGTAETAFDVFQDTVLIFYSHLKEGRYRGEAAICTYMYTIARNIWYQELRKNAKYKVDGQLHENLIIEEPELLEINKKQLSEVEVIRSLMKKLDVDCRKILTMFYYQKKTMQEITEAFGFNAVQSAKTKKYRCMKKLEDLFAEGDFDKEQLI